MKVQTRKFYSKPPTKVARDIIGKILVRNLGDEIITGRIVEAEAYGGRKDPASHAYRGQTKRNSVMFGEAGHAYVYFTYGFHHCLNFVTGREGEPSAVLVRAIEPIIGIEAMQMARKIDAIANLTNGPGKVCQALQIDRTINGSDITNSGCPLFVVDDGLASPKIAKSQRIGIKSGLDKRWRFYDKDSSFVSH